MNYNWKYSFSYSQVIEKIWWKKLFQRKPMLNMQEKPGLIHETNSTKTDQPMKTTLTAPATPATISHREGIHIMATDSNRINSQMNKSQTTMVNEATCSSADHMINFKNSITNDLTNMSTPTSISSHATDQSQSHSRQQQQPQQQQQQQSYSNATNNANMATPNSNNTRPAKRTANDYRFGKTIGEGSFSSVYIAQDIHTKKEVASKLIFLIELSPQCHPFQCI